MKLLFNKYRSTLPGFGYEVVPPSDRQEVIKIYRATIKWANQHFDQVYLVDKLIILTLSFCLTDIAYLTTCALVWSLSYLTQWHPFPDQQQSPYFHQCDEQCLWFVASWTSNRSSQKWWNSLITRNMQLICFSRRKPYGIWQATRAAAAARWWAKAIMVNKVAVKVAPIKK